VPLLIEATSWQSTIHDGGKAGPHAAADVASVVAIHWQDEPLSVDRTLRSLRENCEIFGTKL